MAQISIFIEDWMAKRLNAEARELDCSVSRHVINIVSEHLEKENSEESRKKAALQSVKGASNDDTFVIHPDKVSRVL